MLARRNPHNRKNEMLSREKLLVFSGTANPELTGKICRYMNITMGTARLDPFPDGEIQLKLEDDVRGRDCFVVQSTCPPVNDTLMELLIFVDCLRRASALRITAVLPYFGYARQDRKSEGRTPISAKLVANMITTAGANRILAMDLHAEQVQGFFDIPVDHLHAMPILMEYFQKLPTDNVVLVSPDVGNVKAANMFAQSFGGEFAVIDKRRVSGSEAEAARIIGEVEGKDVLMVDDMVTTAGTVCSAAFLLKDHGARSIRVAATHGIFAGPAVERLAEAPIDEVVVTDTVPLSGPAKTMSKIRVLSVSHLLGEAIIRIHKNKSVSAIFSQELSLTGK